MMADVLSTIETPALVIDRGRMLRNIDAMASAIRAAGVSLRPHFKTSKMIEVAQLQMAAGAVGFTCATRREVTALLEAGISDVFWANSTAMASKAEFAAAANREARVAVGLDSPELGALLSEAALDQGTTIPVLLEVDTGLRRTGVDPSAAERVADDVSLLPGIALQGVYMHEGQLASLKTGRENLRGEGEKAAQTLVEVAEHLRRRGHDIATVSVGSTPGSDSAPLVEGVTEARPGTYVFFDANSVRLESAVLESCAVTVVASVVSAHRSGQATIDAGVKAMSSDRSNRDDSLGVVVDLVNQKPMGLDFRRAYEEHGILEGETADKLGVGDRVRIVPNHACGVVNMWSRAYVVDGDTVTDIWSTVGRH